LTSQQLRRQLYQTVCVRSGREAPGCRHRTLGLPGGG